MSADFMHRFMSFLEADPLTQPILNAQQVSRLMSNNYEHPEVKSLVQELTSLFSTPAETPAATAEPAAPVVSWAPNGIGNVISGSGAKYVVSYLSEKTVTNPGKAPVTVPELQTVNVAVTFMGTPFDLPAGTELLVHRVGSEYFSTYANTTIVGGT